MKKFNFGNQKFRANYSFIKLPKIKDLKILRNWTKNTLIYFDGGKLVQTFWNEVWQHVSKYGSIFLFSYHRTLLGKWNVDKAFMHKCVNWCFNKKFQETILKSNTGSRNIDMNTMQSLQWMFENAYAVVQNDKKDIHSKTSTLF